MWLTRFALTRPVITAMVFIALVIFGMVSYFQIGPEHNIGGGRSVERDDRLSGYRAGMKLFVRTFTTAAVAAGLLCAAFISPAVAAVPATVMVNGQAMNFDQPPIERGGRIFVPMRGVFENLGATVVYSNGTINATGRGHNISLHIGSNQATVDGQNQTLDEAPFVVGSRTLIPLRFVAQALGAAVDWNQNSNTVRITGGGNGNGYNNNNNNNNNGSAMSNSSAFSLMNRTPTGSIYPGTPRFRATFSQPVRRGSVVVYLDGNDVTSMAGVTPNGFDFMPQNNLGTGVHRIRVVGTTRAGAAFDTGWRVVVQ